MVKNSGRPGPPTSDVTVLPFVAPGAAARRQSITPFQASPCIGEPMFENTDILVRTDVLFEGVPDGIEAPVGGTRRSQDPLEDRHRRL